MHIHMCMQHILTYKAGALTNNYEPAGFDVMIDSLQRYGTNLDSSILLDEHCITRQISVNDAIVSIPS